MDGIPLGLLDIPPPFVPRPELPLPRIAAESERDVGETELSEPGVFAEALADAAVELLLEVLPCERRPMLWSPLPFIYCGLVFCLLQLHPVNRMPRPHAPIRLVKGFFPIGLSSPVCDSVHATPQPQRIAIALGAASAVFTRADERGRELSHSPCECQEQIRPTSKGRSVAVFLGLLRWPP
jgi:hypothetical protein